MQSCRVLFINLVSVYLVWKLQGLCVCNFETVPSDSDLGLMAFEMEFLWLLLK